MHRALWFPDKHKFFIPCRMSWVSLRICRNPWSCLCSGGSSPSCKAPGAQTRHGKDFFPFGCTFLMTSPSLPKPSCCASEFLRVLRWGELQGSSSRFHLCSSKIWDHLSSFTNLESSGRKKKSFKCFKWSKCVANWKAA